MPSPACFPSGLWGHLCYFLGLPSWTHKLGLQQKKLSSHSFGGGKYKVRVTAGFVPSEAQGEGLLPWLLLVAADLWSSLAHLHLCLQMHLPSSLSGCLCAPIFSLDKNTSLIEFTTQPNDLICFQVVTSAKALFPGEIVCWGPGEQDFNSTPGNTGFHLLVQAGP